MSDRKTFADANGPAFEEAMRRGRVALAHKRMDDAAQAFATACALDPKAPEPAFARCLALLGAADQRAGTVLQSLLASFPAHAAGWENLGQVFLKAEKGEASQLCFSRAMAVEPTAPRATGFGLALRSIGRAGEARAAFAEACRLDPRAVRPAFLLALCAQDARDYLAARDAYRQALAIDPALPEAWVNLGTVLQEMGDLDGAKQAYGTAIRARRDTFGRVSQALTAAPKGELWLDLGHLRRSLAG